MSLTITFNTNLHVCYHIWSFQYLQYFSLYSFPPFFHQSGPSFIGINFISFFHRCCVKSPNRTTTPCYIGGSTGRLMICLCLSRLIPTTAVQHYTALMAWVLLNDVLDSSSSWWKLERREPHYSQWYDWMPFYVSATLNGAANPSSL